MYDDKIYKRKRGNEVKRIVTNGADDFEQKLKEIKDFLLGEDIKIEDDGRDGRLVSRDNEGRIVADIRKRFPAFVITPEDDRRFFKKHPNRDRGDFYIKTIDSILPFPVNLKLVTDVACNLCGTTTAVSTALYNVCIEDKLKVAEKIVENYPFTEEKQRYGFVAVHKISSSVKVFTLFSINEEALIINRSNGFQFKFNSIRPIKRTQIEGQEFIQNKFKELCRVEAEPYDKIRDWYVRGRNQITINRTC